MKKLRLVSKKMGSGSLKRLQQALTEHEGYKVWRSRFPKIKRRNLLYGDCKDKLYQYQWFAANEVSALPFTTDHQVVSQWLQEGATVVGRTLLRSSEGKGIVLFSPGDNVTQCPVYTRYLKKKKEFRVHVFDNQVVSVLEKRKKTGTDSTETKIRNTKNGYVFCRENVVEPEGIRELAVKASKVTSSLFKGVDIGYNEKLNQLFVIEVNSAPGCQGTTVQDYVKAIVGAN
jgi:glutathione synthase/RimK-type ligase-like ATP-grasp enzyme